MSMEKSFASLLRHSKLATFDRRLNQVYSSPKHSKRRGDWGLKRNLPTVIRTPFVTVGQLDTIEHQTLWDSGHSQVAFLQRWKENFSNIVSSSSPRRNTYQSPHKPQRQPLDDDDNNNSNFHNLTSMTRSQFERFIKYTITPDKARAFHHAIQSHQLTRDQLYNYLQVTFRPSTNTVVGPIYNYPKQQQQEVIVHGRILNKQSGGYAVGISGVVAFLPKRYAVGLKKPGDRWMVRSFYVQHAYMDDQGNPQVTVSLLPRSSTSSATLQISDKVSSPTSALPLSSSTSPSPKKWSLLENHLFATTPLNYLDDFLTNSQQPLSTKSTITSLKETLLEHDTELANRFKKI